MPGGIWRKCEEGWVRLGDARAVREPAGGWVAAEEVDAVRAPRPCVGPDIDQAGWHSHDGRSGGLESERGCQRRGCFANCLLAFIEYRSHAEETVNHAVVASDRYRHPRLPQQVTVGFAFVAERVEL